MQGEPRAWSVASARLAVKDRREPRDVLYVLLLWAWIVLAPLGAISGGIALVVGLARQSWDGFFLGAFGLAWCVPGFFFAVKYFRKEIGRPRIVDWIVRRCAPRHGL